MNLTELLDWQKQNPTELLCPCANFKGVIHYAPYGTKRVDYHGNKWVETACGLKGVARDHLIVFGLPMASIECQKCQKVLATNKKGV